MGGRRGGRRRKVEVGVRVGGWRHAGFKRVAWLGGNDGMAGFRWGGVRVGVLDY